MNFEQEPVEENPFAEAETSPWRVVGVYRDVETDNEEQEQVYYAADKDTADKLREKLATEDPNKNWHVEENPDYLDASGEAMREAA